MGKSSFGEWSSKFTGRISCRSWWQIILLTIALVFGLSTSTWPDSSAEQQKRLEAHYALERPGGNGPFPAVMMVPGFGGFADPMFKTYYPKVANQLKGQGFVVLKVDSLSARGRNNFNEIIPDEVTHDIVTAATYLRAQSFVKTTAINVIGWGYGAGIALDALSRKDNRSLCPVDAVVVYTPDCNVASPWKTDAPVLVFCGAKDTENPPAKFESLLSKVPARQHVKFIVYPDAYSGFYNSDLPTEKPGHFATLGYNEKAAKAAWGEVERFLRR